MGRPFIKPRAVGDPVFITGRVVCFNVGGQVQVNVEAYGQPKQLVWVDSRNCSPAESALRRFQRGLAGWLMRMAERVNPDRRGAA